MKKILYIVPIWWLSLMIACAPSDSKESKTTLTATDVENYIRVYKQLKQQTPDILQGLQHSNHPIDPQHPQFNTFRQAVESGGIADYNAFVPLNAKIGMAFAVMQAGKRMDKFQALHEQGAAQFDQGVHDLELKLTDPNLPESAKAEIRRAIAEIKKGKTTVQDNWSKNQPWAIYVMNQTQAIAHIAITQEEVQLIQQYEKAIMEAYTGLPAKIIEQTEL